MFDIKKKQSSANWKMTKGTLAVHDAGILLLISAAPVQGPSGKPVGAHTVLLPYGTQLGHGRTETGEFGLLDIFMSRIRGHPAV